MSWKKMKLGELITENKIPSINPDPNRRITVRLNVLGVEKRPLENEKAGATKQFIRKAGQFIYGKQNFHKGAFGIIPDELDGFESSADLPSFDVREDCLSEWIFYFFKQGGFYLELAKIARGVATQRIHPEQIYDLEIPLPDIETQKNIIASIIAIEEKGEKLNKQLSHQLTLLESLNQAILQEVVQGKLLPQDSKDEPASELLKRIASAKLSNSEIHRTGFKARSTKPIPPIKPEEIPFDIPDNWVWCRLDEVCAEIIDCPHSTPKYLQEDTGYYAIDTTCIEVDGSISRLRNLSENGYEERIKRLEPMPMDIIFAREGSIGLSTFIPENIKICLGQRVMLFRCANGILPEYLKFVITDKKYLQALLDKHRGIGAKHVNVKDIKLSLIPLPPLSEQKRIVAEIEKQFAKTKELKEHIIANQQATEQLLKALLHQAFEVKETEEV